MKQEIARLERELFEKQQELAELKRGQERVAVNDYELKGSDGTVHLSDLFGDKNDLIVVHNMG